MAIKAIITYLLIINVVTFTIYGIDKGRARKGQWRVPESALLWLAAAGGSVGACLGMKVWRHKTLHKKFRYGIPAIIMAQIAIATAVAIWWYK